MACTVMNCAIVMMKSPTQLREHTAWERAFALRPVYRMPRRTFKKLRGATQQKSPDGMP